jgi:3'-phosphoadenosine 5'-phosphosulfate sulfotransferase (PAPS reductase)/FAD synthetase
MGFGVQSWTLCAMSALGELPKVDVAIHSDTGHERSATYAFAAEWTPWLEQRGVQVATVRNEARGGTDVVIGDNKTPIPAHTVNEGKEGRIRRQCTSDWKIQPIRRYLQAHRNGQQVELWLGITTDEFHRAKDADVAYITHTFPLLDLGMSRGDCLTWLEAHDLPTPGKSSCSFCPFLNKRAWQR